MLVDPTLGLFVVADGMGGHNAGEVASALAVQSLKTFIASHTPATEGTLAEGLCQANDEVLDAGRSPEYAGMGTTVVAACIQGGDVLFGSVGDSRIYLWREGALRQLTTDDSWVSRVIPGDVLSEEDVQRHPMRHVLTKVVGLREDLDPAIGKSPFGRGDVLVLCTDGLHGWVVDQQIAETIETGTPVDQIAQRLVDRALTAGATDNVTVVVVRRE